MNLEEAIQALNDGYEVTHDQYEGYSLIKRDTGLDSTVRYFLGYGWNDRIDPYHKGDTYYKENILPVYIKKDGKIIDYDPEYRWKNDSEKRCFPVDGWRIVK